MTDVTVETDTAPDPQDPATGVPSVNPVEIKILTDLWHYRRLLGFGGYYAGVFAVPVTLVLCHVLSDADVARVVQLQGLLLGVCLPLIALAATYMTLCTVYGPNAPPTLAGGRQRAAPARDDEAAAVG